MLTKQHSFPNNRLSLTKKRFTMRVAEFIITCVLIEITPGPNMSYLIALALARGHEVALRAVTGVACGLLVVGLLAAFGLATFIEAYPLVGHFLRWGGVLFILWLAIQSWVGAGKTGKKYNHVEFGTFWLGFTTNLFNPKLTIFYLTLLPDFIDSSREDSFLAQHLQLLAIYITIATSIHIGLVMFAGKLRHYIEAENNTKIMSRIMALLLLGIAIWFVVEFLK